MTLKKKAVILLGIAAILVIGGIIMINPFTGKDEPKYKSEQDRIANYLVDHYELANGDDIKTIEFIEFEKNDMTGYWRITARVNNKYYISFSEKQIGGELEGEGYYSEEIQNRSDSRQKVSIKSIKIKYIKE
ncbi:hypothetical protein ACVR1G_00740 [Streptococcus dentasini]